MSDETPPGTPVALALFKRFDEAESKFIDALKAVCNELGPIRAGVNALLISSEELSRRLQLHEERTSEKLEVFGRRLDELQRRLEQVEARQ